MHDSATCCSQACAVQAHPLQVRLACDRLLGKHVDIAWVPALGVLSVEAYHSSDSSLLHSLVPGDSGMALPCPAAETAALEAGVLPASLPGRPFRPAPRCCVLQECSQRRHSMLGAQSAWLEGSAHTARLTSRPGAKQLHDSVRCLVRLHVAQAAACLQVAAVAGRPGCAPGAGRRQPAAWGCTCAGACPPAARPAGLQL